MGGILCKIVVPSSSGQQSKLKSTSTDKNDEETSMYCRDGTGTEHVPALCRGSLLSSHGPALHSGGAELQFALLDASEPCLHGSERRGGKGVLFTLKSQTLQLDCYGITRGKAIKSRFHDTENIDVGVSRITQLRAS
jgi:hypothetical protein